MYIVYGNLSLCDILYIILNCIQILSFNIKGSSPACYLFIFIFFVIHIFKLHYSFYQIKLLPISCHSYFVLVCGSCYWKGKKKQINKQNKDDFVRRVQYSNIVFCASYFSGACGKSEYINMTNAVQYMDIRVMLIDLSVKDAQTWKSRLPEFLLSLNKMFTTLYSSCFV